MLLSLACRMDDTKAVSLLDLPDPCLRQLAVGLVDEWLEDDPTSWQPLKPGAELAALAQLTALQGLTLFTSCILDSLLELTQLQQLRSLTVKNTSKDSQARLQVSSQIWL